MKNRDGITIQSVSLFITIFIGTAFHYETSRIAENNFNVYSIK